MNSRVTDMKERQAKKCRHFNGLMNVFCKAGVRYSNAVDKSTQLYLRPCFGECALCDQYSPWTAEERAAQDAEYERQSECIKRGVSPCCEAPIDESQVLTEGQHKGHGPRYCSKCKALVYLV